MRLTAPDFGFIRRHVVGCVHVRRRGSQLPSTVRAVLKQCFVNAVRLLNGLRCIVRGVN